MPTHMTNLHSSANLQKHNEESQQAWTCHLNYRPNMYRPLWVDKGRGFGRVMPNHAKGCDNECCVHTSRIPQLIGADVLMVFIAVDWLANEIAKGSHQRPTQVSNHKVRSNKVQKRQMCRAATRWVPGASRRGCKVNSCWRLTKVSLSFPQSISSSVRILPPLEASLNVSSSVGHFVSP